MTRRARLWLDTIAAACLLAILVWRIHQLRKQPPPLVLLGRAAELDYVRFLGHRLEQYATAYGRPIYHYEIEDSRYAVDFAKRRPVPAESVEIATLRRLLYQPRVEYGFDRYRAYIGWRTETHVTRDSFPWAPGVGEYAELRKAAVAPPPLREVKPSLVPKKP